MGQRAPYVQLAVLGILCEAGEVSISDMIERLGVERKPVPTTVVTILSRLEKRDVVERCREGGSFLYRPRVDLASHYSCTNALPCLGDLQLLGLGLLLH